MSRLGKKKAPGGDGIAGEVWKLCEDNEEPKLREILERVYKEGVLPKEWKKGIIVPVFKKGKKNLERNYRTVALMDTGYKIYTDILRERLVVEVECRNMLNETQMGFRAGRGTVDAVYMIKNAV